MARVDRLAALGRTIATLGDDAVDARQRAGADERLAALRAELRKRRRAPREESLRGPVALGLAFGAAAAAVILWPAPEPLTFAVGEPVAAGVTGAWVVAPPARATPIVFSDGTHVALEGGGRARVLAVTARGARLAIERGTVHADVVHRPRNDWSVVAGPFEIHVTGTRFDAAWDPEREVLRVSMREGRVVVRASCLEHERALSAGEAASLSCAPSPSPSPERPRAGADDAVPATAAPHAAPAPRPGATAPGAGEAPAGAATDAGPPVEAASWRELAQAGDYKGALAAIEARDYAALCATLPAADLLEIGSIARLAGRSARAVEAYGALRQRFPGTDAAASAAFHLGQMAFDGAHAYAEAHRWFSTYLTERPGGALAAEALGRAMEAEERSGDVATARETARSYLSRYPRGAHAELARSLLAQ